MISKCPRGLSARCGSFGQVLKHRLPNDSPGRAAEERPENAQHMLEQYLREHFSEVPAAEFDKAANVGPASGQFVPNLANGPHSDNRGQILAEIGGRRVDGTSDMLAGILFDISSKRGRWSRFISRRRTFPPTRRRTSADIVASSGSLGVPPGRGACLALRGDGRFGQAAVQQAGGPPQPQAVLRTILALVIASVNGRLVLGWPFLCWAMAESSHHQPREHSRMQVGPFWHASREHGFTFHHHIDSKL